MTFDIEKFKHALIVVSCTFGGMLLMFIIIFAAAYTNIPKDQDMNWANAMTAFIITLAIFFTILINVVK